MFKLFTTGIGHHENLGRATTPLMQSDFGFTGLQNAICHEVIKVATDASRGEAQPLSQNSSGRGPILQNGAGDGITRLEILGADFHNSIVS